MQSHKAPHEPHEEVPLLIEEFLQGTVEARVLLDMIEATTDPEGTFAHGGVLKASPKAPTHKAPHSAMEALRAEPGSLRCRADDRLWGHPQAGWVKSPQARALADQKLCTKIIIIQ